MIAGSGPEGHHDSCDAILINLLFLVLEAKRLGDDGLVTLIYYTLDHIDGPTRDLIRDVLDELLPKPERMRVMSVAAEQWETEGFNRGILQGRDEGEAKGEAKGKAEMLLLQLRVRFAQPSPEIEERVRAASSDQLDEWSVRLMAARELSDVLGQTTH